LELKTLLLSVVVSFVCR